MTPERPTGLGGPTPANPPAGSNSPSANPALAAPGTALPGAAPLLAEIADLAASPVPEPVFLQELLKRAVQALGAVAGVIWMYDKERRLVLQTEIRLQST